MIHEMLRRERYVGRIAWNRTRFIKRPGTNKRVSRPRPPSEWSVQETPELRIIDRELWARVQDRLVEVKRLYGRGGRNGLMNRAADSPYMLTALLKCGVCGANLIILTGRGKVGNPAYGCPQNYMRGACSNSLKMRLDVLEKTLFEKLQGEVMESEIVEYTLAEFERQLKAKVGTMNAVMDKRRARIHALEADLGRLVAGMAETGHSRFMVSAVAERERELASINREITGTADGSVDAQIKDLRQFVETA